MDRTFAKSAVWIQGMSLKYFSADVRCDREVVRTLSPSLFRFVGRCVSVGQRMWAAVNEVKSVD